MMPRSCFDSGRKEADWQVLRWPRSRIARRDGRNRRCRIIPYLSQAREVLSFSVCKVIDNAGGYPASPVAWVCGYISSSVVHGGSEP